MYDYPDTTCSAFGIKTQEEYLERYVFKGKFHAQVHEDVIKSYETVEYLMAHAYYHYKMYDEALKKLLGIFEMAVRIRSKELGIESEYTDSNGWKQGKKLHKLTKALSELGYPDNIFAQIEHLREMRNMFSHPKRHSFGGGMFAQSIVPIVNILNQLFFPTSSFIDQQKIFDSTKNELEKIQHHLFVLPYRGQNILAFSPQLISSVKVDNEWYQFIDFNAVVKDPETHLAKNRSLDPAYIHLKNIQINSTGIEGLSPEQNVPLKVEVTLKPENLEKWLDHKLVFDNLTPEQRIGRDLRSDQVYDALQNFIYENCW